jgi:hypothetical protein
VARYIMLELYMYFPVFFNDCADYSNKDKFAFYLALSNWTPP